MEIERKWKLKELPNNCYIPKEHALVEQHYITSDPDGPEIRIRKYNQITKLNESKMNDDYTLTIKSNNLSINNISALSRSEVELPITESIYNELVRTYCSVFIPIIKNYFQFEFAGFTIEISLLNDNTIYAEVEFENNEQAEKFTFPFPDIVLAEVTNDPKYQMRNYYNLINQLN